MKDLESKRLISFDSNCWLWFVKVKLTDLISSENNLIIWDIIGWKSKVEFKENALRYVYVVRKEIEKCD